MSKQTKTSDTAQQIKEECSYITNFLLEKNAAYGNSAFEPMGIFSRLPASELVKARIDDKLSRLMRGKSTAIVEDTVLDLIGYLIILRVILKEEKSK